MTTTEPPVAVVTGAGSGIGRAVARRLAGRGYRVAVLGRRRPSLLETLGGATGLVVPVDVADPGDVAAAFAAVRARWGRVDLLLNNAGTFGPVADVGTLDPADWQSVWQVNVSGFVHCAREAVAIMLEQEPVGGRIINNGSISAHVPRPQSAAYAISKTAVTGLTRAIGLDYRDRGICCTQIDVGNAGTPMTDVLTDRELAQGSAPEPRFDVSHVADAVEFLAGLPLTVTVPFLTMTATAMPYLGRG